MTDADARRRARATWPIRVRRLGDDADDLSETTTADDRLAMMWPLAVEAWRLAGRPLPDYDRAHIPSRLLRPGEPRDDEAR